MYFTGRFTVSGITFGNVTLLGNSTGGYNIFVAKYDSSGNFKWAVESKNNTDGEGLSIATDASGNAYLAGTFQSSNITFSVKFAYNDGGGSDVFLAKFNQLGIIQWIKSYGGQGQDKSTSIAIENAGAVYMTGYYNYYYASFSNCTTTFPELSDDMYTVKFNAITGLRKANNEVYVTIFPNPTYSSITIHCASNTISKVILYYPKGDCILQLEGNEKHDLMLELNSLPSAMYFIGIYLNDGTIAYQKLIKN